MRHAGTKVFEFPWARGSLRNSNLTSDDMYCAEKNYIFVHIQKSGGNSVRSALGMPLVDSEKHLSAGEMRDTYGRDVWEMAFKFTFVRNPWSRLVSWWAMIDNQRRDKKASNEFGQFVLNLAQTFDEFLVKFDQLPDESSWEKYWLLRSQSDIICDGAGERLVDFVGRFERLEDDFRHVANRVGLRDAVLPHTNASQHDHYVNYYTPRTRRIVEHYFEKDISDFGYRFGDPES